MALSHLVPIWFSPSSSLTPSPPHSASQSHGPARWSSHAPPATLCPPLASLWLMALPGAPGPPGTHWVDTVLSTLLTSLLLQIRPTLSPVLSSAAGLRPPSLPLLSLFFPGHSHLMADTLYNVSSILWVTPGFLGTSSTGPVSDIHTPLPFVEFN